MRPEGESGRGTGLGPQEALGSGWEASQPGGLGLAWAVLQSSDRCPARGSSSSTAGTWSEQGPAAAQDQNQHT